MPHAAGQTPTPAGAPYVLKVGEQYVTLADFDHIFRKNNRDGVATVESLDAYMELFINFKLKVLEAQSQGLDTAATFKKELAGYRSQLARPYLIDSELLGALVEEAWQRNLSKQTWDGSVTCGGFAKSSPYIFPLIAAIR